MEEEGAGEVEVVEEEGPGEERSRGTGVMLNHCSSSPPADLSLWQTTKGSRDVMFLSVVVSGLQI